jgi:hypothetical protein
MRTPLRVQVSEYDCVPTTFVNALAYLFERHEIPPAVLQRVYMLCLDCMFHTNEHGHGTSDLAIEFIASWLTEFRSTKFKKFRVEAEYVGEEKLNLGPGNKLVECLNSGGVGVLSVKHFGTYWHEILALSAKDRWLYAFDPYPKSPKLSKSNKAECYEFIVPDGPHEPNLRIHYDWLDKHSEQQPFRLGLRTQRGGVLIRRVNV